MIPSPSRARVRWREERGSGAVLAIALIAAVAVFGIAGVTAASALGARQRIVGAADLAALAGADVASGAISGSPCEVADGVARANGARLDGCEAEGLVVSVVAVGSFAGTEIVAGSTAGPPP